MGQTNEWGKCVNCMCVFVLNSWFPWNFGCEPKMKLRLRLDDLQCGVHSVCTFSLSFHYAFILSLRFSYTLIYSQYYNRRNVFISWQYSMWLIMCMSDKSLCCHHSRKISSVGRRQVPEIHGESQIKNVGNKTQNGSEINITHLYHMKQYI